MQETIQKNLPVVYESTFSQMYLDNAHSILFHFYKEGSTSKMLERDYKHELTEITKISLLNKVETMITDNRHFDFPITPELQEWTDKNIFAKNIHLKKCAVILCEDLIGQLSLEQVTDENTNKNLSFQLFENLEQANQWAKQA